MTARQQIARLLPLVLLIVLVIVGLRGAVPVPGWNGPLKAYGVAIGIALEVIFGVALLVVHSRDRAARRLAEAQPYDPASEDKDVEPPQALRFTLRYVLGVGMLGVAAVLIANIHLQFLAKPRTSLLQNLNPKFKASVTPLPSGGHGGSLHIPVGPILYALLIVAIVAAIAVSIWWSTRLRRPAAPQVIADVPTEELREAIEEARAAIIGIDDARAAIIACYVAMERRLADRGAGRKVADTPDELLARAVASGTVRGGAASRLTGLFYEARFSTHPLSAGQRDAASAALDELAKELKAKPRAAREEAASAPPGSGGGWV
ncbi:MAG: DUF4129 domain-containing protein [Trebonia sp.]